MALASTSPDPPSPLKHLEALYPLACTLVGDEAAPSLLVQVYDQVAGMSPDDRPDTLDGWIALLLGEVPEGRLRPNDLAAVPDAPSSPESTALRRDVAERLVREALPVALATCSAPERVALILWASRSSESSGPPHPNDLFGEALPSPPTTLLRDKLDAILSAPEAALVDETTTDADLEDALRDALRTRFSPVPSSLRARLRATLRSASSSEDTEPGPDSTDESGASSADTTDGSWAWLSARPRTLLFFLVLGALVLAGGLGVSYLTNPSSTGSPSSPPGLVAFSAEQAGAVTTERAVDEGDEAEAYLDSTWGRQVHLPTVEGAQLEGIGRLRTAGNTQVPVVLYTDADDGARIAAFVYSYALVDRLNGTATLDPQVRAQLAEHDRLVAADQDSEAGLLWRDRANIFVVVSSTLSPDTLRARIQP